MESSRKPNQRISALECPVRTALLGLIASSCILTALCLRVQFSKSWAPVLCAIDLRNEFLRAQDDRSPRRTAGLPHTCTGSSVSAIREPLASGDAGSRNQLHGCRAADCLLGARR